MLGSMRRVVLVLALAQGFAPAPSSPAPLTRVQMKKPSPALEAGPLPGLSQTNYNVLIGVTALGVSAPALLAATAVLPSMLPAKAPPAKGKPTTQAAKAPVGAAKRRRSPLRVETRRSVSTTTALWSRPPRCGRSRSWGPPWKSWGSARGCFVSAPDTGRSGKLPP